MVLRICYFLTAKELCKGISQISKRLHTLADNPILWKELLSREMPDILIIQGTMKTNWKSYFIKVFKRQHCPLQQITREFSKIKERQITCIDQYNTLSTQTINLNELHRLQFEDIFTKKLKWDVYVTIGICVKPLDTMALLQQMEYGTPPHYINQLRKFLEQAWKHQKAVQSLIKQNLKDNGWTILDNCSRRNFNSVRTIPKNAAVYWLAAKVHRWENNNSVVFINYPVEDYYSDLNLLKNKFTEKKRKNKMARDHLYSLWIGSQGI